MKPTKEEVRAQFRIIFDEKIVSFDAKNLPPVPPSIKEIREDIRKGRIRIQVPCGCKPSLGLRYEHRAPEIDDVLGRITIYPASVDAFLKEAKRHFAKRLNFKTTLTAVKVEATNDVLYGKANFNEALDKLRAVTVRQKRRE